MNYLSFFDCLVSLTVMSSTFIHVVTNLRMIRFLLLRLKNIPLYIDIYTFYLDIDTYISITFSLVIYPLRHLGCFHLLAIVNNSTMKVRVYISPFYCNSMEYVMSKDSIVMDVA